MQTTLVLLPGMDGTGDLFAPLLAQLPPAFIPSGSHVPQRQRYVRRACFYGAHIITERRAIHIGGRVVFRAGPVTIAAQQPHGLAGLVLCASFLRCPRTMLTWIRRVLRAAPPVRVPTSVVMPFLIGGYAAPSLRQLVFSSIREVSPRTLLVRLSNIAQIDVSNLAIEVPCLYLRARSDRLVPKTAGETVRKMISSIQVVDLAGPHLLLQSNAKEAVLQIERFASRVVAR